MKIFNNDQSMLLDDRWDDLSPSEAVAAHLRDLGYSSATAKGDDYVAISSVDDPAESTYYANGKKINVVIE